MPERINDKHRPSSRERLQYQPNLVGLQTRLLMGGEALNPNNLNLPQVSVESLGNFANRDYSAFNNASNRERKEYWLGKENNDFNKQKQTWTKNLVNLFADNKDYFRKSETGKKWSRLYTRLGVNTQEFTMQNADALYNKYLTEPKKETNLKKFIQDVLDVYKKPEGQVDYEKLYADLDGIQWLANIFGDVSAEITAQLSDAEAQAKTQPQNLIDKANKKETNRSRINRLTQKEKELLGFVSGIAPSSLEQRQPEGQHPPPPPGKKVEEGKKVGNFWLTYERPGDPRQFPNRLPAYNQLARDMKARKPEDFKNYTEDQIARRVRMEIDDLQKELDEHNISQEELNNLTVGYIEGAVLKNYRSFIERTYGLSLPKTEELQVIPIAGLVSKYINPEGHALAFVHTTAPFIYIDFNVIKRHAINKGYNQGIWEQDKYQIGELIKSLLAEIQPHEYTHLLSELAYWKFYYAPGQNPILAEALPGRVGLEVSKVKNPRPKSPTSVVFEYSQRGEEIMEAVTVELTRRWARSQNTDLDIPAYQQETLILYELQNLLKREDGISNDESFKQFAKGYFTKNGFIHLNELVNGHVKQTDGKFNTKRPHLLSIVYGLMDYEANKNTPGGPSYPLTYSFLQRRLSVEQKQEIRSNLNRLLLPPRIREYLRNQIA